MKLQTEIARFGLEIVFRLRHKFIITFDQFDPKRKDAYILIFNHSQLNDALFIGMSIPKYPYPVASNLLYTDPATNFGLTKLVTSIPKRKGQADSRTIRRIMHTLNKENRGIMIAPEGNSSFYGKHTPTDYLSTAKLVKKLKKDLVIAKVNGGFFAHPRWGKSRIGSPIEINYKTLIKAEDFDQYSIDDIKALIEEAISFNDYLWNKDRQYRYKHKNLAKHIERVIYACPTCGSIQSIKGVNNDIHCDHCGKIAHINDKQFIEGPFDTMIKWQSYQVNELRKHLDSSFRFEGVLYALDLIKHKRLKLGHYQVIQNQSSVVMNHNHEKLVFDIKEIKGITLTQKNNISFDYEDKTYAIKLNDPMLFRDLIKMKKGDL